MEAAKKKKRLVILTNNLCAFGGGEKFALDIATRMKGRLDISIADLVSKKDTITITRNSLAKRFDLSGIRVMELKSMGFRSQVFGTEPFVVRVPGLSSTMKLMGAISSADSVYQVSLNPVLLSYTTLFSSLYGKRFVLGVHNFSLAKALDASGGGVSARALRSVLKRVKFFHVLNERDLGLIKKHFPKATVKRIPNFIAAPAGEIGNNRKEFICLYVGRLEKNQKGIDLLAEIIQRTLSRNKSIKFHLVGRGGDGEGLVAELQKRHRGNVTWSGFLQGTALSSAYRNASLLVFPSRYDTFSLVLLEAQSHGLPAITFDVPGPSDIIKEKFQGTRVARLSAADFSAQVLAYYRKWGDAKAYLRTKKRISKTAQETYAESRLLPELERFLLG